MKTPMKIKGKASIRMLWKTVLKDLTGRGHRLDSGINASRAKNPQNAARSIRFVNRTDRGLGDVLPVPADCIEPPF